jgi:hypothetical protein
VLAGPLAEGGAGRVHGGLRHVVELDVEACDLAASLLQAAHVHADATAVHQHLGALDGGPLANQPQPALLAGAPDQRWHTPEGGLFAVIHSCHR